MANAYLERQRAVQQGMLETGEDLGMQKMWDYVQIVLRDPNIMGKDTFGKARLQKVFNGLKQVSSEYHICFTDDKEADYYQEKLDAQLKQVWGDEFHAFYERYPQLKKLGYKKPKKGWV